MFAQGGLFTLIPSLASKYQELKIRGLQFHFIKQLKTGIPNLRTCHFESSEDIITKFENKHFMSYQSNIEKLVGHSVLN